MPGREAVLGREAVPGRLQPTLLPLKGRVVAGGGGGARWTSLVSSGAAAHPQLAQVRGGKAEELAAQTAGII